jgi:hypothetical protein
MMVFERTVTERTRPARPVTFPLGVADSVGRRAFVRVPGDGLVALELAGGTELWRTKEPLRPLITSDDRLVAMRAVPRAVQLIVLDTASGREHCASPPLPLPEWANVSLEDSPEFAVDAVLEDGAVVLRWSARARYRGGAAPSRKIEDAARRDAGGGARVDVATCAVEMLDDAELPDAAPAPSRGGLPSSEPEVLEQHEVGGRRFQLLARRSPEGTVRFILRAMDAAGQTAWESTIGEGPLQRPRRARP